MKWKNALIRAFVWLASPTRARLKHLEAPKNFLIVSTTGLGDTLWGTPAIAALRKAHPNGTIAALTSPIGAEVLKQNPHIDAVYTLGPSLHISLLRLFKTLRSKQFDAALIFHTSQRIILPFCVLIQAKQIIGTAGLFKGLDTLLTSAIEKKVQHEVERRLDIVKQVGARPGNLALEMVIRKSDVDRASCFLKAHGISEDTPLVGIHPGARNLFKQWPKERFIEVGNRLCQSLGCRILVSGDQSEACLTGYIASKIPGAISLDKALDLTSLAALMGKMDLLITNDTGPMHMAFSAKTPTVAIFGPTDPQICGPYGNSQSVKVLKAQRTCQPCIAKACLRPFCLFQISPNAVYEAALSIKRRAWN